MSWAMSPQQCHMLQRHVTTALSHQWGVATWWFRSSAVVDQNIFLVLHFSKFLLQLFFSLHLSLYVLSQRLKIQRKFHRQHNRTMIYFNFQKQQTHFYKFAKYYIHIYCQFIFNVRILFTLLFKRLAIQANSCTLFYEMQCTNLHSFWYGSNLVFSEVLKGFELYECLFYLFIQIIELLYQALGS